MTRTRAVAVFALALVSSLADRRLRRWRWRREDPRRSSNETFNNPTSDPERHVRPGLQGRDLRRRQSRHTSRSKLGGKFQAQPKGSFPSSTVDVSRQGRGRLAEHHRPRRTHVDRRAGIRQLPGHRVPVPQRALSTQFMSTYAQLQAQSSSQKSGRLCCQDARNQPRQLADRPEERGHGGRARGRRPSTSPATANVSKLVEDLKTIAQKAGSALGNVSPGPAQPARTRSSNPPTSTSTGRERQAAAQDPGRAST